MTKKENFVLLSLDDHSTKDVANAVSSKTGKKILAYMEDHEKITESDLVKKLSLAPSTVHHTIEQLAKANLIEDTHYHYSSKGKEVKHWSLANKLIIIAPKKTQGLYDKIKDLLPAFLLTGFGSLGIYFSSFVSSNTMESATIMAESDMIMARSFAVEEVPVVQSEPNVALWFFLGAFIALILVFLYRLIFNRK